MQELNVPNESDWENYLDDLDTKYTYKNFFGKSNEQMQALFKMNIMAFAGDLYWMPIKPFQYYILGYRDFVLKRDFESLDSPDAASIFLNLIYKHLEKNQHFVIPIFNQIKDSIDYVAELKTKHFMMLENIFTAALSNLKKRFFSWQDKFRNI
jgi:hypothetical protein